LKRLRRENQVKDIRQRESQDLLTVKRDVMLLFIIVGRLLTFL
jgi:hypothetical protein